jgi:hypothetical protein
VITTFDQSAILDHADVIGVADGLEFVSNDDDRAVSLRETAGDNQSWAQGEESCDLTVLWKRFDEPFLLRARSRHRGMKLLLYDRGIGRKQG